MIKEQDSINRVCVEVTVHWDSDGSILIRRTSLSLSLHMIDLLNRKLILVSMLWQLRKKKKKKTSIIRPWFNCSQPWDPMGLFQQLHVSLMFALIISQSSESDSLVLKRNLILFKFHHNLIHSHVSLSPDEWTRLESLSERFLAKSNSHEW